MHLACPTAVRRNVIISGLTICFDVSNIHMVANWEIAWVEENPPDKIKLNIGIFQSKY